MEPINDNLNKHLKQHRLKVPDGYFEQLEQDILKATIGVQQEPIIAKKRPTIIKQLVIVTAVAATFTMLFIGVRMLNKDEVTKMGVQFAEMTDAEINNYMDEQIASLRYDELFNYLNHNVEGISTDILFTSAYADAGQLDASITGDLHEQVLDQDVLNSVIDASPLLLEETIMDSIDESLLQEYFNDAALFENLGL